MTKAELAILEEAFAKEVGSALSGGLHLIQRRSKVAKKLAESGHLAERTVSIGGGAFAVRVTGYELTHFGRMAYCDTCRTEDAT